MKYLKLLAKIKEDLDSVRIKGFLPESVTILSDAETEENQGLFEKLLGIPVKVDIDLKDGFKIEVKVDFKF